MITKQIYFTNALSKALKKGAHLKEVTQHRFVVEAIECHLERLGNSEVNTFLEEHEANMAAARESRAQKGGPNG